MNAYYTCFDQPTEVFFTVMDWLIFVFFSLDIIFNCCRQFRDYDGIFVKSHRLIIYRYARSGWLFIDLIGTFPF